MRLPKNALCLLTIVAASCVFSVAPRTSHAADFTSFSATYKVQVEYWFFDTDYYYWSTVLETDDRSEAEFVYGLLLAAQDNGQLNEMAPNSYWRYFAVDVRMITEYSYPRYVKPQQLVLNPFSPTR